MVSPYNGILFNHIKHDILAHAAMWRTLIRLNLKSRSQNYAIYIKMTRKGKYIETETR
jgi:L-rhamnose mutarotase